MPSNLQLVPVYTDWVNRFLSKTSGPNYKPIDDITNELRDYRIIYKLIVAVVPENSHSQSFTRRLSTVNTNLDGLSLCLHYLSLSGVNCEKVTPKDIDVGNLGGVLQLLYALSTYKQLVRQKKKEEKSEKESNTAGMPPSTASKLPSPPRLIPVPAAPTSGILPPTSRLQTPSKLQSLKGPPSPSPVRLTGSLKPPTSNSGIRPPSRGSGNNNGSTISSSRSSSVASSGTYTSIPSIVPEPALKAKQNPLTTSVIQKTKTQLQAPTKLSAIRPPVAKPSTKTVTQVQSVDNPLESKMLKLKLFGGKDKEKKDKTPQSSPALIKKSAPVLSINTKEPSKLGGGLKPPSKIVLPKSKELKSQLAPTVTFRSTVPSALPVQHLPTIIHTELSAEEKKRTSKSSEEDSAYAGFGSNSPASSTQSSMSLHSNSSKGSRDAMCDSGTSPTEPIKRIQPPLKSLQPPVARRTSESQEKPTLAVKGMAAPSSLSKIVKPVSRIAVAVDEAKEEKKIIQPEKPPICSPVSPAVGIVSPMLSQRKPLGTPEVLKGSTEIRSPIHVDCEPSSSTADERKRPPVPSRTSSTRLETTFDAEVSTSQVPSMAPIPVRQPPPYNQLLQEGRIQRTRIGGQFVDSSTSEDSLDSVSTTIRQKPSGFKSENNTLDRSSRTQSIEPTGYTSEGGLAAFSKMQATLREYRGRLEYNDSFEDSSSLSSGVSETFDDVSTDDLSDHPMATVAYGKINDYQSFVRSTNGKGPRSSSSSVDHRTRRMHEAENVQQLLQQCRTSQRGAACHNGTLRSPGYNTIGTAYTPQLALSADGDTLSVHSRASLRISPKRQDQSVPSISGFHSLDRKSHLAEYYREDPAHRLAIYEQQQQRAAMALVSPRRIPTGPPDSMQRHSINGSLSARGTPMKSDGIYANCGRDAMRLHRLADEASRSPSHVLSRNHDMGSQQSLASNSAYASIAEKFEADLRKLTHAVEERDYMLNKLNRKKDDYEHTMDILDNKLSQISRQIERAQALKPEELAKLRQEIETLRQLSKNQSLENKRHQEGAGELLRQPSLESVASMASHRSSMSSSSKSSKTDKSSLNSFGLGKSKRSWATNVDTQIRSSITKAFKKKTKSGAQSDTEGSPMHHPLNTISGSTNRLDEIEVVELKKRLEDKEVALTDIRLDALDKAREVDVLKETINKLRYENKQLKQDMNRMATGRTSRASSQASIPMLGDEDPLYEVPPSSASGSYSSKRSSGCNSVKVAVNVDLKGEISAAICPDNEIIIGFLSIPSKDSTWAELDQQLFGLFDNYMSRVDPDRRLGLDRSESVIGYQMGGLIRQKNGVQPSTSPSEVLTPTTTIRMFLGGAKQHVLDSLVLESLFPRVMLEQLLQNLLTHRRLVLAGAMGIGKSKLARLLAVYLTVRNGMEEDSVVDIKIPEDTSDKGIVKVEKHLESLLREHRECVILIDNIPKHRIAFVSSIFSSAPLMNDKGPYVICTVNRTTLLPEMEINHRNFKLFTFTNHMDGVKEFMPRFLRRRLIEAEYRLSRQTSPELAEVIKFLPTVLQAVNSFIEKTNSHDVTVGPRPFLQCPLGVDESRNWFVRLWNEDIIPYMGKVAKEGINVLGRCGTFEDPTNVVIENWPWIDGPRPENLLRRVTVPEHNGASKHQSSFNPMEILLRLESSKHRID